MMYELETVMMQEVIDKTDAVFETNPCKGSEDMKQESMHYRKCYFESISKSQRQKRQLQ